MTTYVGETPHNASSNAANTSRVAQSFGVGYNPPHDSSLLFDLRNPIPENSATSTPICMC